MLKLSQNKLRKSLCATSPRNVINLLNETIFELVLYSVSQHKLVQNVNYHALFLPKWSKFIWFLLSVFWVSTITKISRENYFSRKAAKWKQTFCNNYWLRHPNILHAVSHFICIITENIKKFCLAGTF
jgi:hypothetical protein